MKILYIMLILNCGLSANKYLEYGYPGEYSEVLKSDSSLTECLTNSKYFSTAKSQECLVKVRDSWIKLVKDEYDTICNYLDSTSKSNFIKSHESWKIFVERQVDFCNEYSSKMEGTMSNLSILLFHIELYRNRYFFLKDIIRK